MIRPATVDDIPEIIRLGQVMATESVTYRNVEWDIPTASEFLREIIEQIGVIFLFEREGEIIGGFGGSVTNHWFSKELYGFDLFLFVHPDKRGGAVALRLINCFETWARLRGAKTIHCGITTGIKVAETSRLYRAIGFEELGPLFIKGV